MLMKLGTSFLATLPFLALQSDALPQKASKAPAFFLAGDSTTAVQSIGGGGWGDGFLNTTLKRGATGKNFGSNGATTVSFREEGKWAAVLSAAKASIPSHAPYVTIQFGHNDQKPAKNISMAQLTANLVAFVDQVRAVPATPILVTSLSRRRFNANNTVSQSLADVTAAAKEAAAKTGAALIDLNAASTEYLNDIGPVNATTYNLTPDDFTHLNNEGSVVFGNMMAVLLHQEVPAVRKYVQADDKIAKALRNGQYYFPEL